MPSVLISLSSFGAAEVGRHGQLWCTEIVRQAGADGSEVRGELLRDAAAELPGLQGRAAVYSSPDGLFARNGSLDVAALTRALHIAQVLQAARLKMAIGDFSGSSHGSLPALKQQLAQQHVELLIENDQTRAAGTVDALEAFFKAQDAAGLDLGMTFDMGNWHWLGVPTASCKAVCSARALHPLQGRPTPARQMGRGAAGRIRSTLARGVAGLAA